MGKQVFATANSLFSPSSEGIHQLLEEKKVSLVYDFKKFLDRFFSKTDSNSLSIVQSPLSISRLAFSDKELQIIHTLTEKSEC